MVIIRKFEEKDAEQASNSIRRALKEVNYKDYPPEVIEFMVNAFSPEYVIEKSKKALIYVAELNEVVVGTVKLQDDYIGMVFVNPDEEYKGIGTALMDKIENSAIEKGLKILTLPASLTAIGFYEKRGYIRVEIQDDGPWGLSCIMTKEL